MSPHAAKARGIFDRGTAPIGGHEGMPEDVPADGLLEHRGLMSITQPEVNPDGLMPELTMFDASGSTTSAGAGEAETGDDDLGPMAWPPVPLVRTTSTSSAGSAEAEESEVRQVPTYGKVALLYIPLSCRDAPRISVRDKWTLARRKGMSLKRCPTFCIEHRHKCQQFSIPRFAINRILPSMLSRPSQRVALQHVQSFVRNVIAVDGSFAYLRKLD